MKFLYSGLCLAFASFQAPASGLWIFEEKISLTGPASDGVYHHLDGAGRKHLALSDDLIAVTWEDNRSRSPQVYVALKSRNATRFATAIRASDGSEAYEPGIGGIGDGRFLLAYEQDGNIYARLLTRDGLAEPHGLSKASASHVSVAAFGPRILATWRERRDAGWFVVVAFLRVDESGRLSLVSSRTVEPDGLQTPVLFPSVAINAGGIIVAWEDRRAGHTRLLISHADIDASDFSEPVALNEYFSARNEYDKGTGVTRVSLSPFGEDEMLAAWMDNRRGGVGYGIYAALGSDEIFGPNEKVHGEEGDRQPHYNPATAGNRAGDFAIAWDDFRRGDSDVWISSQDDGLEWGQDLAPETASGGGEQSHPSIALDERGNLHLLWIERADPNAASSLWYSLGRSGSGD